MQHGGGAMQHGALGASEEPVAGVHPSQLEKVLLGWL